MTVAGLIRSAQMSEGENPFSDELNKAKRGDDNSKTGWIAAGVLAALLIGVSLFLASTLAKARRLETLGPKLNDANASLTNALAEIQQDKGRIAALQKQVADLEKERDAAGQKAKGLEDEMRSALESKDVTISSLQG